jgi:hypothetical protein
MKKTILWNHLHAILFGPIMANVMLVFWIWPLCYERGSSGRTAARVIGWMTVR